MNLQNIYNIYYKKNIKQSILKDFIYILITLIIFDLFLYKICNICLFIIS